MPSQVFGTPNHAFSALSRTPAPQSSSSQPSRAFRPVAHAATTSAFAAQGSLGFRRASCAGSVRALRVASDRRTKNGARAPLKIEASRIATTEKWWRKNHDVENLIEVNSTEEFLDCLASAGDRLVIVDFFASWCGACRALYPKLVKIATAEQEILFVKVNFDENKPMCKSLGVKVLPFFHFYRGSDGRLAAFSASVSKVQRLRDAIAEHNTARCSIGGPAVIEELLPREEDSKEESTM